MFVCRANSFVRRLALEICYSNRADSQDLVTTCYTFVQVPLRYSNTLCNIIKCMCRVSCREKCVIAQLSYYGNYYSSRAIVINQFHTNKY